MAISSLVKQNGCLGASFKPALNLGNIVDNER